MSSPRPRSEQPLETTVDGVRVVARTSQRRRKTIQARREGDHVVVHLPAAMARSEQLRWLATMGERVLARERRAGAPQGEQLMARATRLAREHLDAGAGRALRPTEVKWVTSQNRRWASCSPQTGVIRLSHRLQGFPSWVLDYVLVHELAHLAHAHHDANFHALVARYPRAELAEGFLRGWVHANSERPGSEAEAGALDADEPDGVLDGGELD